MTEFLAVVDDYDQLIVALRQRVVDLDTTLRGVGEISGLADGYVSKLLAPHPTQSVGRRSLGPILGSLGLRLALIEDAEALARIRHRLPPRVHGPRLDPDAARS